jgi:hypothetical protein
LACEAALEHQRASGKVLLSELMELVVAGFGGLGDRLRFRPPLSSVMFLNMLG